MSEQSKPQPETGHSSSAFAKLRQMILFLLLLLAIVGLVWEFAYSKPAFDRDLQAAQDLLAKNEVSDKDSLVTNEQVQTELDKEPSEVKEVDNNHQLEIYRYRRGIPIRHYSVTIGYRKIQGKWIIWQVWDNNESPADSEWVQQSVESSLDVGDTADIPRRNPTGAGAGGGGGGRGGNRNNDDSSDDDSSDDADADDKADDTSDDKADDDSSDDDE